MLRLTFSLCKLWEFINVFTSILAIWHTETKVEIKTFQQLLSEIMPFNHAKVLNRLVPNCKLYTKQKKFVKLHKSMFT